MFKFGRKNQPNHRRLAFAISLPELIERSVPDFFQLMLSDQGTRFLHEIWNLIPTEKSPVIPPDGMQVDSFREGNRFFSLITPPPGVIPAEPMYQIVVFGPIDEEQLNSSDLAEFPYRYFIGQLLADSQVDIAEVVNGEIVPLGLVPSPEPNVFVQWIMNETVRTNVQMVESSDAAMEMAIATARESLAEVTQRFLANELENFTVKVIVSDEEGNHEHFWLSDTAFDGYHYSGIINEPAHVVNNIADGQHYTASPEEVTDWMHLRDEKMVGNFTLRAMLGQMPPSQAAQYLPHLSEDDER